MLDVQGIYRGRWREVVARVQIVIAEEPERRTVVLVGAALGHDVDDRAGRRPVFGGEVACVDLELLDRFQGRPHRIALAVVQSAQVVDVAGPIQQVGVLVAAVAVGRIRLVPRSGIRYGAGG